MSRFNVSLEEYEELIRRSRRLYHYLQVADSEHTEEDTREIMVSDSLAMASDLLLAIRELGDAGPSKADDEERAA